MHYESGWLHVAYALLSQITRNTPLGYLHLIRARPVWGTDVSSEISR
ncbi:hypothetical protein AB0H36_11605 [Kribbella sp. NPDC050820]